MSERILITGPDGFVGTPLCARLLHDGFVVRGAQLAPAPLPDGCESVVVGDLASSGKWPEALDGVDRVIHLAARVHVMNDTAADPLQAFRHVNVEGTRALAEAAACAGVKRFVFISTVKVLGEATDRHPFAADDPPAPQDPYGVSKLEAERLLSELARRTGMQVAVVRPPLVYGPGVRANFLKLMSAVNRGLPLPFGLIKNRRSLVGLDNLVDLLARCLTHENAAGQAFLVSDGRDLSTAELIRLVAAALGRRPALLPVPPAWMKLAGRALGKGAVVDRLCGSLELDISKTRQLLDWTPPVAVEQGLCKTAAWFLGKAGTHLE